MNRPARSWIALALAILSGCTVPPRLTPRPALHPVPALNHTTGAALRTGAVGHGAWPRQEWWRKFRDPQLNHLMTQALANNPGLALAAARLESARAQVLKARAQLGSSFGFSGGVNRERLSANGLIPPPFGGISVTDSQLAVSAHRELDWWHRDHDLILAASAALEAQEAQLQQARLLLAQGLLVAYFQFAGDEQQRLITERVLADDRTLLTFAEAANQAGASSDLPVVEARAEVANTRAHLLAQRHAVRIDRIRLAALAGHGPDWAAQLHAPVLRVHETPVIPAHLALDLLAHRPDITARYWLVRAAAARVRAAKAGFYPNIDLSATAGLDSLTLSRLLSASSLATSAGIAIHLPLFMPGTLKADLGLSRADYDAAVDQYNDAIVSAARDVGIQLSALTALQAEQTQERAAVAAEARRLYIVRARYQAGAAALPDVLHAERAWLAARAQSESLKAARFSTIAVLTETLGGGYQQHHGT